MTRPKRMILGLSVCFLCAQTSYAQKTWTLQECIDYAVEHNIDLQKQNEMIKQKELQLNTAQNARLPHLSAGIDDDFSFHNILTEGITSIQDGLPSSADMMTLSASVNASLPLIDAGRIENKQNAAAFSLESAIAQNDKARRDLGIQVAVYYLNILYYQGLAEVSRKQVELSRELVRKADKQVREGAKPESELVQTQSQLATDEYQFSVDCGKERIATIELAQLLTIEDVSGFQAADPSFSADLQQPVLLLSPDSLFNQILEYEPSIRAAEAEIKAAEAVIQAEKSNLLPSLDLVGSISTRSFLFFNKDYKSLLPSFPRQLAGNHLEAIGLRLKIPIFTGFQTRNAIRMAQSQLVMQKLELSDQKLQLRTELEQAYYNAEIAYSRYNAAVKAEISAATNYDYQLKSYEAGRTTIFDLNMINQQWLHAQQNVLQSRYDYLIRLKILDFYIQNNTRS